MSRAIPHPEPDFSGPIDHRPETPTLRESFRTLSAVFLVLAGIGLFNEAHSTAQYPVVDTGQASCYDNDGEEIGCPESGEAFAGQDAQYSGNQFSYTDNGDGTVSDNVTGLMWQQTPENIGRSWQEAVDYCTNLQLGGYDDWRIPGTKELFSISDFSEGWPYLDTNYFSIAGTSVSKDEQYWADYYVGTTAQGGSSAAFGVNHGTGHIKAYPANASGQFGNYARCVHGDTYGVNDFVDNGDGSVTDNATGLMWQQADSGSGMDWEAALAYAESATTAGYNDWRLPNIKELQSIVDYSRSPSAGNAANLGPAIDTDFFEITELDSGTTNYDPDYGYFWSSTSAYFGGDSLEYYYAWYVAFGTAVDGEGTDFHGAGGMRFDTKYEGGPLGEGGERFYNSVRLVRNTNIRTYPVVDTGQSSCYDNRTEIECPFSGEAFHGQDAQFTGNAPSYTDNGDGTVTDNVTGLMWQQSPDTDGNGIIEFADELTYSEAMEYCEDLSLAGYDDWRLPHIKQLYSLIDFNGTDPSGYEGTDSSGLVPFIDTDYFDFAYGDTSAGERIIDVQYASSTLYVVDESGGLDSLLFGVNFADGRIKGYRLRGSGGGEKTFSIACVRENASYGENSFIDNGDGTISDSATGLMWQQDDSGEGLNWEEALTWVATRNDGNYLGFSDWRLPNVKELQSIVDYTRAPDVTDSASIDPLFTATEITNEAGSVDYAYYWSGTTHANSAADTAGRAGAYVAFGRSLGYMNGSWTDVHGAGSQRSDPKEGDPNDYPTGRGPQNDAIRIYSYVRMVRDIDSDLPEGWIDIGGLVSYGDTPVCAVVLANGQHMFSCDEDDGQYSLGVPLDENGQVTLFSFADGFAPFAYTLTPSESTIQDIAMSPSSLDEAEMSVEATTQAVGDPAQARVTGTIDFQGIPVCALVLANGQHMFSCDGSGSYDLTVPLDADGQITLFGFADGFAPYKQTLAP